MQKRGFTLLEILIVIVISVSVLAFALPSYKKTQERNMYSAATGVLMDLGDAVLALQADLQSLNGSFPTGCAIVAKSWQTENTSTSSDYYKSAHDSLSGLSSTRKYYALFSRKYLEQIPFDSCSATVKKCGSGNVSNQCTYKGYTFYICTSSSSNPCCGNGAVVCMNSTTAQWYKKARYFRNGQIEQIS